MVTEVLLQSRDSTNLKELETKISTLERTNFDLKMQLFYLNENKISSQNGLDSKISSDFFDESEDDEKVMEIIVLKGEIEILKRKVEELEGQKSALQSEREKEAEKYQRSLKMKPYANVAVLEENLKREREAAILTAERDAALISKLQQDISKLQAQNEVNLKHIAEFQAKVSEKSAIIFEKEEIILKLSTFNSSMQHQLDILTEKSKFHELIIRSNGWSCTPSPVPRKLLSVETTGLKDLVHHSSSDFTEIDDELKKAQEQNRLQQNQLDILNREAVVLREEIEKYKLRESEMLYALEGVIKRCQELEAINPLSR